MLIVLFWVCVAGLFYIYLGYPLLAGLLAKLRARPVQRAPYGGSVSVLIVACNEAAVLPRKIRSLLASEAQAQIGEIVVASDGSTDETAQSVAAVAEPRVRLVAFPARRGKASVLNEVFPQCRHEIVVLTDARQEVHPRALGALLSNFADESVGVVSGELVFREEGIGTASARGMDVYWSYEKFIRKSEAAFGSVPGATGALYAIRKKLFHPIPPATLLDDVLIPMQAVARGFRCVFEEGACVYDDVTQDYRAESRRKRRTIAGIAQLMRLCPRWLLPWANPIWLQFVSHKIARLFSPFLLFALLASNVLLARSAGTPYRALLWGQMGFYAVAAAGWFCSAAGWCIPGVSAPFVFVRLNVTTFLALLDAFRGRFNPAWQRGSP
jgi:poly-beta-1,6-N-acetyl-D-glucosamine synthase